MDHSRSPLLVLVFVFGFALAASGCGADAAPTPAPTTTAATATATTTKPAGRGAMPVIERLTEGFGGTVTAVRRVSGYVYVAVDVGGETRWVVSLPKDVDVGDVVSVRAFGRRDGFASAQLGITFDRLWFAIVSVDNPVIVPGAPS